MAIDFTKLAATAKQLIEGDGRSVTLVKMSRTSNDPDKPWRGVDKARTMITATIVFTQFDSDDIDGSLIRRDDIDAWAAAVAGQDLTTFEFVEDGTRNLKILNVQEIKPATVVVAYRLQLRQ